MSSQAPRYVIEDVSVMDRPVLCSWSSTLDEARAFVDARLHRRYHSFVIYELTGDGIETVETRSYEVPRYEGPLRTVVIQGASPETLHDTGMVVHRAPIECMDPFGDPDDLPVDRPWCIVESGPVSEPPAPSAGLLLSLEPCRCARWHKVVGAPDAVQNLIDMYGEAPAT